MSKWRCYYPHDLPPASPVVGARAKSDGLPDFWIEEHPLSGGYEVNLLDLICGWKEGDWNRPIEVVSQRCEIVPPTAEEVEQIIAFRKAEMERVAPILRDRPAFVEQVRTLIDFVADKGTTILGLRADPQLQAEFEAKHGPVPTEEELSALLPRGELP